MSREHLPQFSYTKRDFKLDWFSGTGAGGQHRNKHQNCLRLTHIPSGITVTAQTGRDRSTNLKDAFRSMKPKLVDWIRSQLNEFKSPRSDELVRTYHEPDNRVLDHASGDMISFSDLNKKFGDLVSARLRAKVIDSENRRDSGRSQRTKDS